SSLSGGVDNLRGHAAQVEEGVIRIADFGSVVEVAQQTGTVPSQEIKDVQLALLEVLVGKERRVGAFDLTVDRLLAMSGGVHETGSQVLELIEHLGAGVFDRVRQAAISMAEAGFQLVHLFGDGPLGFHKGLGGLAVEALLDNLGDRRMKSL